MDVQTKISPAFEPLFADSDSNSKRDAIVIYRTSALEAPRLRGRLRVLKERLALIEQEARAQSSVQAKIAEDYQQASMKRRNSGQELRVSSIGASVLPVAAVEVTKNTIRDLARQNDVVAILPNQKIRLIEPKKVDYEALNKQEIQDGLTWGLKHLDIPKLWEITRGEAINVAVLDTGVHAVHPALDGRVTEFVHFDPLGRRITVAPMFDCDQHGTHVCGTIAGGKTPDGVSIGVAPEANLMVAGVFAGGGCTMLALVEGISWAIEKGADIVSMSLGFSYYEPNFSLLIDLLINQFGILPVVAIGNENHGNSSCPGNVRNALAVGAVEKSGSNVNVASFSSGASLVFPSDGDNALINKPDVVAPGVQVLSSIPPQKRASGSFEYNYMDGSSMATPHVAGVVALLMAAKPQAPVHDIVEAIKQTAKHPSGGASRPDNRWGHGLIQPLDALNAL